MRIKQVRCFHCGNTFKIDLDKPYKTGTRKSDPNSVYGMFRCDKCDSTTRIVSPSK